MSKKNMKSYMMLISSMLIFGTIGIFRKYIPLSSGMIAFFRGLLGSAFLFIFFAVKGHKTHRIEKKKLLMLTVTGAILGLNWILLFEAYNYTSVATATMCYYMQPTIVILLSPITFQERITIKKGFCAIASIIGMVFVSGMMDNAGINAQDITGILCGLGAAVFYSLVVIMNKKVQIKDVYEKTIIQLASSAIILIPYLLLTENWSAIALDTMAVVMVLIIGIVHTGIAYALYFGSMKDLKAQSIAVLSYIDPVFALLLSAGVLHEKLSVFGVAGAVLILGSALISEINGKWR
ncbi:MAG: DMT family transporter [Blautia sp.]|nr:DMT family transporter [Blautia sp.]MDD7728198.1 DMT family transporter [Clostridia bacterium]MDY5663047.1 DMT family transporter [Blautia sp.]